jgi:hypothetical protein
MRRADRTRVAVPAPARPTAGRLPPTAGLQDPRSGLPIGVVVGPLLRTRRSRHLRLRVRMSRGDAQKRRRVSPGIPGPSVGRGPSPCRVEQPESRSSASPRLRVKLFDPRGAHRAGILRRKSPPRLKRPDRPRPGLQFFGIPARITEFSARPRRLSKESLFLNLVDGEPGRLGPRSQFHGCMF